jgi:xylan 1,4-beta-xylosidase
MTDRNRNRSTIRSRAILLALTTVAVLSWATDGQAQDFVQLDVDISQSVGEMYPMWAWWGYDEPNYTYTWEGQKLLTELAELSPVPVYVRAHNLLNTDEGSRMDLKWGSSNAYTEDENGNAIYDWEIVDQIMDTYVERGIRPLVEIGFMPKALSSNPEPYKHDWSNGGGILAGWAYPPTDYEKWAELVYQWVRHSIDRYGEDEVETWWWELWNEPDIVYWQGTPEEYFKLYDYTVDAVKRALPAAMVGGPTVTGGRGGQRFMQAFLEHTSSGTNYVTGEVGSQLDFASFHAKGSPTFIDGHVRMNMAPQLSNVNGHMEVIKSFPEYQDLPMVIGEADPEGCAACSVARGSPQNAYRNGAMYSGYTAASFARIYELADQYQANLAGVLSWSFTFASRPWFDGFREMATNGVDKPVLNVFRMYGLMGGDRVAVTGNSMNAAEILANGVRGARGDVSALASHEGDVAAIMVWNYYDDDLPAPDAMVTVNVHNVPTSRALLHHYRIDQEHSNAYTTWLEMGAPQQVTREQYRTLEKSGKLELLDAPEYIDTTGGVATIQFELPRQGVSLLHLSWD